MKLTLGNSVVIPEINSSSNCRQPLGGTQLPTASHLEKIINENVSIIFY